MMSIIHL